MQEMRPVSGVKKLGGALIIAGTAIGAGMLGIPFAVAAVGFQAACVLLLVNWLIMYATAMLMVEVNLKQPVGSDLNTMAKNTLGRTGQVINWVVYCLLLYSLTTAYVTMGGGLFDQYIFGSSSMMPSWYSLGLFALILGAIVYLGTAAVDQCNKLFFGLKALCFLGVVIVLLPHVKMAYLNTQGMGFNYLWYGFPILITSFGFHIVIPTIRNYFKNDQVVRSIVKAGATIPLGVYLIWAVVTLGVIPLAGQYGFIDTIHQGKDLGSAYYGLLQSHWITFFIVAFENIAVTTSFLGVTLALFHFNQDTYRLNGSTGKRLLNFVVTFIPPILFAIFFINGFLMALGYASIFVCVLLIILPACMAWSLRCREERLTFVAKLYFSFLILVGLAIIILQLLSIAGYLPSIS